MSFKGLTIYGAVLLAALIGVAALLPSGEIKVERPVEAPRAERPTAGTTFGAVKCSRDGEFWIYWLAFTASKKVMGPYYSGTVLP